MLPVLAIILFIAGFFLIYNTSVRAEVPASTLRNFARRRVLFSKWLGLLLLIGSFVIYCQCYGVVKGFLMAFLMLIAIASLIVLLTPLIHIGK